MWKGKNLCLPTVRRSKGGRLHKTDKQSKGAEGAGAHSLVHPEALCHIPCCFLTSISLVPTAGAPQGLSAPNSSRSSSSMRLLEKIARSPLRENSCCKTTSSAWPLRDHTGKLWKSRPFRINCRLSRSQFNQKYSLINSERSKHKKRKAKARLQWGRGAGGRPRWAGLGKVDNVLPELFLLLQPRQ